MTLKPKAKSSASYRRAMRQYGFADGLGGKSARFADGAYQESWRRGRESLAALHALAAEAER